MCVCVCVCVCVCGVCVCVHACVRECACVSVRACTARVCVHEKDRGFWGGLHTKHWALGIMLLSQLNHQLHTQSTGRLVLGYYAPLTPQSSGLHTKHWSPLTPQSPALHTKHRVRGIMLLSHLNHQVYTQSIGPGVLCPSHNSIISFTHKALVLGYHAPLTTSSSALHTKHRVRGIMPLSHLNHQVYTQSTGPGVSCPSHNSIISFTHKAQGLTRADTPWHGI